MMSEPQQTPDYAGAEKYILQMLEDELSPDLTYHGLHHTLDVMESAMEIADFENLGPIDICLLRVGVALHDAGFVYTYRHHEKIACEMAKEILPGFDFTEEHISIICGLILATRIPQHPQTKLEQVMCDADLDYLGRNDAAEIANTLFEELKVRGEAIDEMKWNDIQVEFLQAHRYHTVFSKQNRELNKQAYLKSLLKENS